MQRAEDGSRRVGAWAILAATLLLNACAHFSDIPGVPSRFRERLAASPYWLTIATLRHPVGTFPPEEITVVKRWELDTEEEDGAPALLEIASSSLAGLLARAQAGEKDGARVELGGDIDPTDFFPHREHGLEAAHPFGKDHYEFADLDGKRFELKINGGRARVVFLPAPNNYFVASVPDLAATSGVWTTPFGPESELLRAVEAAERRAGRAMGRPVLGSFLHHDLSTRREIRVVIDPSLRRDWRGAVRNAVDKWNEVLGAPLLRVVDAERPVNSSDCVSGRMLCVRYFGSKDLPMTGVNGYTEVAFDPQTGLVVGGIISIVNEELKTPLEEPTAIDRQKLLAGDVPWALAAMHRYPELSRVRHPAPEAYLEYLMLHELGHFSGLAHNFLADKKTTPSHPTATIMTYPPFPFAHRALEIGGADRARIDLIYRGDTPKQPLPYCSTLETMSPERHGEHFTKRAMCDVFTVGDPARWYLGLARAGRSGVFTSYPDLEHLAPEIKRMVDELVRRRQQPPLNLLTRLGYIVSDPAPENEPERTEINAYLCSLGAQRPQIDAQLATFHGVHLACPGASKP